MTDEMIFDTFDNCWSAQDWVRRVNTSEGSDDDLYKEMKMWTLYDKGDLLGRKEFVEAQITLLKRMKNAQNDSN